MAKQIDTKRILNTLFQPSDLNGSYTVKNYLKKLLNQLFTDFDCFNAKRPFGNSDWEYSLAKCLIENGFLEGTIDGYGDPNNFNHDEFSEIMRKVIKAL